MAKKAVELRTLLGGGYQWDGNPPASPEDVNALVAATPVPLPALYLELLRMCDGGHAFLSGTHGYVRIWPARIAVEYNLDYEVQEWVTGFVGFGDSGGPDMVGFDTRNGEPYPVCAMPFAPMEWRSVRGRVADFGVFIGQLLRVEDKSK
jgi:hypothetical protein